MSLCVGCSDGIPRGNACCATARGASGPGGLLNGLWPLCRPPSRQRLRARPGVGESRQGQALQGPCKGSWQSGRYSVVMNRRRFGGYESGWRRFGDLSFGRGWLVGSGLAVTKTVGGE